MLWGHFKEFRLVVLKLPSSIWLSFSFFSLPTEWKAAIVTKYVTWDAQRCRVEKRSLELATSRFSSSFNCCGHSYGLVSQAKYNGYETIWSTQSSDADWQAALDHVDSSICLTPTKRKGCRIWVWATNLWATCSLCRTRTRALETVPISTVSRHDLVFHTCACVQRSRMQGACVTKLSRTAKRGNHHT
jgi:hypothetical protein